MKPIFILCYSLNVFLLQVTEEYLPLSRIGFDKEGHPVRFFHFGPADSKGILKSAKKNDVIKTIISWFEDDVRVMKEQSKKLGKPVQRWTYIIDFQSYTFAQATHKPSLEFLLNVFQIYEANYPERLKAAIIINTSIYFNLLYSVIKPLLSGATVQKVFIYGKDGWKNDLLKSIDDDVLPVYLGGTRTDPDGDPMCSKSIKLAKPVPEELYLIKSKTSISSQPDAKKLVVSRLSKVQLQVYVDQPESVIEWEFETETRDIGFGLIYKNDRSEAAKPEELVPKQRVDAHLVSEAGMFKCHKSGIYVLVFDNSYSWIHRKEIYCKVSVISPIGKVIPCTTL
nr:SEC14-like protein 2 [Parasteatoda tepidariorum]